MTAPKTILAIDFETQGSDATTTNITEVGLALWKHDGKTYTPWRSGSYLCYEPYYPPQTLEIVELTGITDSMLQESGKPLMWILGYIMAFIEEAELVMAHKKSFDQVVLESHCKKHGVKVPEREWLCTLTEFPWDRRYTCKKLSHLAYDHGIIVDPKTLHRAEDDCNLLMRLVLERYNIESVLAYKREPWVYLRAEPLPPWKDQGVQTGQARTLGFSWERCKGMETPSWPKSWVMRIKKSQLEEFTKRKNELNLGFKIYQIEGIS